MHHLWGDLPFIDWNLYWVVLNRLHYLIVRFSPKWAPVEYKGKKRHTKSPNISRFATVLLDFCVASFRRHKVIRSLCLLYYVAAISTLQHHRDAEVDKFSLVVLSKNDVLWFNVSM